ncbi:MAG: folate family ECF transporter S component [Clostridia bacterium]|nr:folate family ECF transporter S component [Clostridia bacterium]
MVSQKKSKIRLRVLIFSSILCALSVILGQYLSIKIGNSIRIGFGSLPVVLAGMLFGPWMGLLVGAISDIVGCAIYYGLGSMIPLVTLGMMAEGFLAGLIARKKTPIRIIVATASSRIVGTMLLRSLGLYLRYQTPITVLAMRIPCVAIEIVLMAILLTYLLCRNATVQKVLKGWIKS